MMNKIYLFVGFRTCFCFC